MREQCQSIFEGSTVDEADNYGGCGCEDDGDGGFGDATVMQVGVIGGAAVIEFWSANLRRQPNFEALQSVTREEIVVQYELWIFEKTNKETQIGPNVFISTNARVGAGVRLINCIILDDVEIKALSFVEYDSAFSEDEKQQAKLLKISCNLNNAVYKLKLREYKQAVKLCTKFGLISLREHRNGDIPFHNRLFPEKIGYDIKIIDVLAFIEDEEKFSKVSDEDAIRLCLLLSLEVIFMGRELVSVVDDAFLRMVNYLDAWNSFPWGEHIWRQLYDSIRNVCSKHKLEHLDGLIKNPNHVPSYTLSGLLFAFKIWIIESSFESHRWWTRVPEIIPKAVSWTRTAECIKWEYFAELFDKTPIELSPIKAERQSSCITYEKQKEIDESKREYDLSVRVHFLEGLCQCLLTLPKETKRLRGRIFILESIIQEENNFRNISQKMKDLSHSHQRVDRTTKISPKEDVGDVYCCDVNGDVSQCFIPANILVEKGDCE
ncbi:phospholipase-like, aminotransferase-like mobile domain protein, partial [Tanacetum coccineum]